VDRIRSAAKRRWSARISVAKGSTVRPEERSVFSSASPGLAIDAASPPRRLPPAAIPRRKLQNSQRRHLRDYSFRHPTCVDNIREYSLPTPARYARLTRIFSYILSPFPFPPPPAVIASATSLARPSDHEARATASPSSRALNETSFVYDTCRGGNFGVRIPVSAVDNGQFHQLPLL